MRILVLIILTAASTSGLFAQDVVRSNKSRAFSYEGLVQAGMLSGEKGSAFEVQTIHGARYQNWFAGIGAGLDNYRFRTVPLFVHLNRDIFSDKNTPYFFGDIGLQFAWVKSEQSWWWGKYEYSTGVYSNIGAGYRFNLSRRYTLHFNAAWSLKKISELHYPFCEVCNPDQLEPVIYDYTLQRLSLKLGFGF